MFEFFGYATIYTLITTLIILLPIMLAAYLSNEKTDTHVGIHQKLRENEEKKDNSLETLWHNYMKCPYDYPFDLTQQPDKYGYFEVLIGKDGMVYEAPNGHQRGVVMMIARDKDITPEAVEEMADKIYYQEWLLKESGVIMVWHGFYIGTLNEQQQAMIQLLQQKGFLAKTLVSKQPVY